ncbi:MAG: peptidoglycan DD-metalloendopeptidase family protein [Thermodesulfovibrionales bacterium]|nr:peptidoglycan DD-metalloendopeptidase family protein [Thermodesulfovibrionales bacterium]
MKKLLLASVSSALIAAAAFFLTDTGIMDRMSSGRARAEESALIEMAGVIGQGETLSGIFKRRGLDMKELVSLTDACRGLDIMRRLIPGRPYSLCVDSANRIQSFWYSINDDSGLTVTKTENGFKAEKTNIVYDMRTGNVSGTIKDNLVSAMDNLALALELSDIFAWDIDFTTDLREGDTFKAFVEELWLDGEFRKYGRILSAEFRNNGQAYHAYRFQHNGDADYYDEGGNSLRRAFLKSPLSYRSISSGFTNKRFHPILRIFRPHLGVDYSAPAGTPVSSVGDGRVEFSGYKGQNGRMVALRHSGGYVTYYGHLSRIAEGVRRGSKVRQGQVIGYVGTSGLSTGPHLDYRIKLNGRFVNPLRLKMPRGRSVPKPLMAEFEKLKSVMDEALASIAPAAIAMGPLTPPR